MSTNEVQQILSTLKKDLKTVLRFVKRIETNRTIFNSILDAFLHNKDLNDGSVLISYMISTYRDSEAVYIRQQTDTDYTNKKGTIHKHYSLIMIMKEISKHPEIITRNEEMDISLNLFNELITPIDKESLFDANNKFKEKRINEDLINLERNTEKIRNVLCNKYICHADKEMFHKNHNLTSKDFELSIDTIIELSKLYAVLLGIPMNRIFHFVPDSWKHTIKNLGEYLLSLPHKTS